MIREVKSAIPPPVEYHLNEPGLRILTKIQELIDAIYDELPGIMAHRTANAQPSVDG